MDCYEKNRFFLADCWAKTDPDSGRMSHSVLDHSLAAGAVASILYSQLSPLVRSQLPKGAVTLVAAHDIGKLTPGFQLKAPKWEHHDTVWNRTLHDNLCSNHSIISQWHLLNHPNFTEHKDAKYWLLATGGHHGKYPNGFNPIISRHCRFEGGIDCFIPLRDELLDLLIKEFGDLPAQSAKKEYERVHLLTGFTIFSDWISSNTDWFPSGHSTGLDALQARAAECLKKLHWKAEVRPDRSFGQQFKPDAPETFQPRSIQSGLLKAVDSPGLYIVEAPMGMGKTEAALAAAYKRWTKGDERGLYFALPTQLTSNRIHKRIEDFLNNTIGTDTVQTLIHGNAWLNKKEARRIIQGRGEEEKEEANDTDESLGWYSSTRKQLLAPFGTGTIDQALLAVLPAKFSALRYFALAGKVVVIDEVHSFDPYMSALIDRLIRYLIQAGSTVIILSATLTAKRRRELVMAAGAEEPTGASAYPLITSVASGAAKAVHHEVAYELAGKTVRIKNKVLSGDDDGYWQKIADHVEAGANVVVIRNTVALAQETYRMLKHLLTEKTPKEHVGLLHSRFPQEQREKNEEKWMQLLGNGPAKRPHGSLLVSTQIVEQSVDIDADLLVTDLAPVDLVLQRIGRLHRHEHTRPSGFEQATCYVLHPETSWQGSAKEVKEILKPHHFIYPPLSLWQAYKELSSRDTIRLPQDIRPLLESASACRPCSKSSSALRDFIAEDQKQRNDMLGTAHTRDVHNAKGIDERKGTETRYGIKPTAQLVILPTAPIEQGRQVRLQLPNGSEYSTHSGEFNFPLAEALHQFATRIPAYLVTPQLKAAPDWLRRHIDSGVIAIRDSDTAELQFHATDEAAFLLQYSDDLGVTYEKAETTEAVIENYDFWN